MYLYNEQYMHCPFFMHQDEVFLSWVCPQLKHTFEHIDSVIYYEADMVERIFFLTLGNAAFVLPYNQNLVYIDIDIGNHFGKLDLLMSAVENDFNIQNFFMGCVKNT